MGMNELKRSGTEHLKGELTPEQVVEINIIEMGKEEARQERKKQEREQWIQAQVRKGTPRQKAEELFDQLVEKVAIKDFEKFKKMYPPGDQQEAA
jgi:hypothetical protein